MPGRGKLRLNIFVTASGRPVSTDLLETAARALGPMCERVVFLGGATISLWLTDPAARPPRVTVDVDVVADVVTLGSYERFQQHLRDRGFAEDSQSNVICRWTHRDTGLILDAVPLESRLAGFEGQWHRPGVANAEVRELPSGARIRVVPPPFLLATKLEAFADRGGDDCLASRDFEDVVLLVDGRSELAGEVRAGPSELIDYIGGEVTRVLALPTSEYGIEGALPGPGAAARAASVTLPRLRALADRSLEIG
jgi:hypothetical protein